MPLAIPPQVAIGRYDLWRDLEVVAAIPAGGSDRALNSYGCEYRYWTLTLTIEETEETVIGRLLVAGEHYPDPPVTAVVVAYRPDGHRTWVRATDLPETVVVEAGRLVVD